MKLPVHRQSSLENAKCLYRYRQLYIDRVKEPLSPFADRGVQFHRLRKLYVDYLCRSDQECDYDYAESLCTDEFGPDAVSLFRGWFPRQIFNPRVIYGTEVKLRLDAQFRPCSDGHQYSGEFDQLDIDGDHATINDAKSHFGIFEPDTIQAIYYPWLLHKTMAHLKTITFQLDFVRWGVIRSRDFDIDEIDRLERDVILMMTQRIQSAADADAWPAIPNKACAYCSLDCPLIADGLTESQVGMVRDDITAKALAAQLYAMDRRRERLKATLESYAIERGDITMDHGITLGFVKRNAVEYSPKDMVRLNEQHGFDKLRALKVDNAAVKKIGKRYPEIVTELAKTAQDDSTTTFGFRSE